MTWKQFLKEAPTAVIIVALHDLKQGRTTKRAIVANWLKNTKRGVAE